MNLGFFIDALVTVVGVTTPILLAATGELVVEKSGVLNLGIEGMMLIGAVTGFAVTLNYGPDLGDLAPWLGVLAAALAGAASSMLFAVLVLTLGSNQVATGLALAIFGIGLSSLIGAGYVGMIVPSFDSVFPDSLAGDPLWRVVFGYSPLVYFALLMVFAVGWFLNRTRAGLDLARGRRERPFRPFDRLSGDRDPLRGDRLRRRAGRNRRRLFLDGHHADVGRADDRGARLDRAGAGGVLRLARRAAAGGRLLFRRPDDARALRQGFRLLVPAVAVLGGDALYRGRRRARCHLGPRGRRKRSPGLPRPAVPAQQLERRHNSPGRRK